MNHLVFVYGTLKSGHIRQSTLESRGRYIGIARTEPQYGIFQYGGFPALVDAKQMEANNLGEPSRVYGELYEVHDSLMPDLDKIEAVEHRLFERRSVQLGEITLAHLPVSNWAGIANKTATAYFFCNAEKLVGAKNCGPIWLA